MLPDSRHLALEAMLATHLQPLVSELRMTDLITFVVHIANGREEAVGEIIRGAAELHFTPGFIDYDGDADVCADWTCAPSVAMGVRITSGQIDARVRLTIKAEHASVDLQHIQLSAGCPHDDEAALVLAAFTQNRFGGPQGAAPTVWQGPLSG